LFVAGDDRYEEVDDGFGGRHMEVERAEDGVEVRPVAGEEELGREDEVGAGEVLSEGEGGADEEGRDRWVSFVGGEGEELVFGEG